MTGCALSLLHWIAWFFAIMAAIMGIVFWQNGLGTDDSWKIAAGAGFCAWLGSAFLAGIRQALRERNTLRDCLNGKRPADGSQAGIAGKIDAPGQRLRAPLSGADCIAYRYEIFTSLRRQKSASSKTFDGVAQIPSVINTPAGSFRLLAVPTFDFPPQPLRRETAARNAHEYLLAARFEKRRSMKDEWSGDDGAYRCDEKYALGEVDKTSKYSELVFVNPDDPDDINVFVVDLRLCHFSEHHVKRGDSVCVFGLYSQQRGGIIPNSNWGKETRIMQGDGESVIRLLEKRVAWYTLFGVLFLAAAAVILANFLAGTKAIDLSANDVSIGQHLGPEYPSLFAGKSANSDRPPA